MPIYAYKCASCGHRQDILQKVSDPVLELCPACGASSFAKQVTAAGFQLKGSGWYATDFRDGNKPTAADKPGAAAADGATSDKTDKPDKTGTGDKTEKAAAPASPSPTPAADKPRPSETA
jgi:putative FmdB family regulatory protein